jgi:tetratricopeptide (TPR) repeat protein
LARAGLAFTAAASESDEERRGNERAQRRERMIGTWIGAVAMAIVFAFGAATPGLADVTPRESRPAAPSRSQPSNFELGEKAADAGDYARALPLFQKVVKAEPKNADAWNYLGFCHRHLKQLEQALAAYQKALAINPDHRGANEYLGELYLQMGDAAKARERLTKLEGLCPSGCKELDDLKTAIQAHESIRKGG